MKNKLPILLSAILLASCGGISSQSSPISSTSEASSESSSLTSESKSEESPISSSSSESLDSSSEQDTEESLTSSYAPSESSSSSAEEPEALDPMDEPYIARQIYLNHIGDIYSAWNFYRGKGVTIAVIDMGFNPYHEDFYFENGESKVSDLSASFSTNGGNVTTKVGKDEVINMGESHGTFCAGVAAAAINGKGVAGIAPDSTLLLLKTDCKPKSIEKAFRYAADNGAKVVTISIGSYYNYDGDLVDDGSDLGTVFDGALQYCRGKGVVVCSAGGNGGLDSQPTEFTFPGCCDYVIGAGGLAANSSTAIWAGSSYNSSREYQFCDVFAPAEGMFGCCHYDGKNYDGGWNGTSFASPIVAGLAALYFEKNPSKTPSDFENDLYSSCVQLTSDTTPKTDQLGYGRVDAGALLDCKYKGNVTLSLKANWSNANCYVWNSVTGRAYGDWPGTSMAKGKTYTAEFSASTFDSLIFNDGNGQTVDISLTSFLSGKTYSLLEASSINGCLIGAYI